MTGPNGVPIPAALVSVDNSTNGTPRTATYSFAAPGGAWSPAGNGNYFVSLQANQVFDTNGHSVPAATIGLIPVLVTQTLTVTSLGDSGPGTLRDEISKANSIQNTADSIVFDPSLFVGGAGVISLLSALPTISDSVTITGPGANRLTIQRALSASTGFSVLSAAAPGH